MFSGIPLFPEQASTLAADVDNAVPLHRRRDGVLRHARHGRGASTLPRSTATDDPTEDRRAHHRVDSARAGVVDHPVPHLDRDLRLGARRLLRPRAPAGPDARDLRHRQALDVEVPAPRRPERDQRAARAGGPRGQGHVHLGRRAALAVLPGVSHQGRRDPGPLQHGLVHADQDRRVPSLLRRGTAAPTTPAWSARSSSWSRPPTRHG